MLLATLDVEELATEKIERVKNALDDLVSSSEAAARDTAAATQGFIDQRSVQEQLETLALLNDQMAGLQLQAASWSILNRQLQEGTIVTDQQADALRSLARAALDSDRITSDLKRSAVELTSQFHHGATVTDEMRTKLQGVTEAFIQQTGASRQTIANLEQMAEQTTQTAQQTMGLREQASLLNTALLALSAGGIYVLLRGSVDLAARIEQLQVIINTAAKNAGYSAGALREQVEATRQMGITTKESTDAVLSLVSANVRVTEASKLARAAQDLATVSGENSSQTLSRLVGVIETQNVRLLRNMGIIASTDQVMQKYATTLNKTASQLTDLERRQAVVNFILDKAKEFTGAYEASMTTANKQIGSMARLIEEVRLKLGEQLLPTFSAIVGVIFKLWEGLNRLNPEVFRLSAALGTMLAVMVSLSAMLAAAKWLALAAGIASMTTGVGLAIAAIGALAGGFVYLKSRQEETIQKTLDHIGVLDQSQRKTKELLETYKTLSAEGVTLIGATGTLTDKQVKLRDATIGLAKAVPSAIEQYDKLTGSYQLNIAEIERVISANERLRESYLKAAAAQLSGMQDQAARLQRELDGLIQQQKQLEMATAKPFVSTLARRELFDVQQAQAQAEVRLEQQRRELADQILLKMKELSAIQSDIRMKSQAITELTETTAEKIERVKSAVTASLGGWDEFLKKTRQFHIDISKLSDTKILKDPILFRETLAGIVSEVEKANQKAIREAEANAKRYETIQKNLVERANQDSVQLRATADQLNQLFATVLKTGDEERYFRFLKEFNKELLNLHGSALAAKSGFEPLRIAIEDVVKVGLATWAKDVNEQLTAMEQGATELAVRYENEVIQATHKAQQDRIQLRESVNEKILDLDRDLYERMVVSKMSEVDQEIFAERRRVEELSRSVEREIRERERALRQREIDVQLRAALAEQEVQDLARTIERKRNLRQAELEAEREALLQKPGYDEARVKLLEEEIRLTEEATIIFLEKAKVVEQAALAEVRATTARAQATIDADRQLNAELAESQRAAVARQAEALKRTEQEIRAHYDVLNQFAQTFWASVAESATKTSVRILTAQMSLKEGLISIWRSIQNSLFRIFDEIVDRWIRSALRMATAGGGFDIGRFVGGLLGRGQMATTGMAGMVIPGTAGPIRIPGTPTDPMTGRVLTPFSQTTLGSGLIGGAAGGLVGFGIGSATRSRGWGTLSGAATGASIGTMMGGPIGGLIGGGIGAIAGFFGGLFGQSREWKEVKQMRADLEASFGGWEKLAELAQKAGYNIHNLWDTKKVKDYEREVKKLQEALDKYAKAEALKEAKHKLDETYITMVRLGKQAQLVGFDLRRLYDAKTIEDFNTAQEELSKLLDAQQKRLDGLQIAAGGLQARVQGLGATYQKAVEQQFKGLGEELGRQFAEDFEAARKAGFTGSAFMFAKEHADRYGLSLERILAIQADVQASINRIGQYAMAIFGGVLRETGDIVAALTAVSPALDQIAALLKETGTEAQGAFQYLMAFRETVRANEDIAQSLSGINQILMGLAESGRLTAEMFNTLGADAAEQWRILAERGVAADQALLLMQPTLQTLYEAQKNFGFATDEATQKLIDMGIEQGIIGDQFQSVNQKILDMLVIIAEVLGADIPEAYRRHGNAATEAGRAVEEAVQKINNQLDDEIDRTRDATQEWREFEKTLNGIQPDAIRRVSDAIDDLPDQFSLATDAALNFAYESRKAVQALADDVNAVSFGHSPGGLKEIAIQSEIAARALQSLRDRGRRSMADLEDVVTETSSRLEDLDTPTPWVGGVRTMPEPQPVVIVMNAADTPVVIKLDGETLGRAHIRQQPTLLRQLGVRPRKV